MADTKIRTAKSKSEYKRVTAQGGTIRPPKPKECIGGCPPQQVCDHCQWSPRAAIDSQATPK